MSKRIAITWPQRAFLWAKLLGENDKDAALQAGYSLSVAQNTKGKIWSRPGVREEYEYLDQKLRERYSATEERQKPDAGKSATA